MNIIHISAECFPIAKVGGLADVVGALPKYQNSSKTNAKVIMPYYDNAFVKKRKWETYAKSELYFDREYFNVEVLTPKSKLGVEIYLIKINSLLDRELVYGYEDDFKRFLAFQIAALNFIAKSKFKVDVVHCHDHHTGFVPFMMSNAKNYKEFKNTPSVLTIHNAQYQGQFDFEYLHLFPEFEEGGGALLDWDGMINPLAAAIKCAWKVTTVSPSYMEELIQKANGLELLLRHEKSKCLGILNGIDDKVWDSNTDKLIAKNYAKNAIQSGKKANKKVLCNRFNLDIDKPLFSFIGRLVYEKGADLFPDIFYKSLLKEEANILLLGSGDSEVESKLKALQIPFKKSYNTLIGYDEKLAHQMYAGSDFLLMPSRVEPCGLNQMYALRYGTIPIVRRIGGLKDTVIDIGDDGGFGICHDQASVDDVVYSIDRAVTFYADQKEFRKIRKKCMQIDHSWGKSAKEYISLYKSFNL